MVVHRLLMMRMLLMMMMQLVLLLRWLQVRGCSLMVH
jgi:hypothetical protein